MTPFEVEVAPPERAGLTLPHAGSGKHAGEHADTEVLGFGRSKQGLDLISLRCAHLCSTFLQLPRWQVGVRARVGKDAAPLVGEPHERCATAFTRRTVAIDSPSALSDR